MAPSIDMRVTADERPHGGLDERLYGTRAAHFRRELFGNAAHFPLANLFFEVVTEGRALFLAPDAYVLLFAAVAQAWIASGWERQGLARPFRANLIGPLAYVALETAIEGVRFFDQPNHQIYLAFGLAVGAARWALERTRSERGRLALLLGEGASRGAILLFMYAALEARPAPVSLGARFWVDDSHVYIALALVSLGLLIGLFAYFEQRAVAILRDAAKQLREFSEWSLGPELTSRAVADREALALRAAQATILFVDLRGFTSWSETRAPGEVVAMLNEFYAIVGHKSRRFPGLVKMKFTADEALLAYPSPSVAIDMACALRDDLGPFMSRHGLDAGFGVHFGPTVQGLLGSETVRHFDVIGDTVNVGKRLCDRAGAGEILVSRTCWEAALAEGGSRPELLRWTEVTVKGKALALGVASI